MHFVSFDKPGDRKLNGEPVTQAHKGPVMLTSETGRLFVISLALPPTLHNAS